MIQTAEVATRLNILAQRRLQNASNANVVSAIVSPRVIRFGVRVTW